MMQQSLRRNRGDYYIIHEMLPPAGIPLTLSTSDSISSESLAIFMLLQGQGIKSPVEAEFSGLRPTTTQAPHLHFPQSLPCGDHVLTITCLSWYHDSAAIVTNNIRPRTFWPSDIQHTIPSLAASGTPESQDTTVQSGMAEVTRGLVLWKNCYTLQA